MGTIQTEVRVSSASENELVPGTQVGEYVIEAKLGEGGFGKVYAASHPVIGKRVAVKLLARQYSADPEMLSRFVAEARAVNQIRHRNIIDIFGFGHIDDGRHYYVMELLDGEPLDRVIEETGGMSLGMALPILREVARALDAAHANGIAHRDLKPENIFLVRDHDGVTSPKLLDFGIAKLLGPAQEMTHKTRTGAPIGTPYYMSPEQARGRDVDHRTDIYSFGCLVYELLTGQVPFDGDGHLEVLFQQISNEPVPPSQRAAQNPALAPLPAGVDDAIAWMMKKDPADRPPDLAAAVHAIEEAAIAAGVEIPVEPVRASYRSLTPVPRASSKPTPSNTALAIGEAATIMPASTQRTRRAPWVAIAAAAIVAIAVVVVIVMTRTSSSPPVQHAPAPIAVAPPPPAAPPPAPVAPVAPQLVTIRVDGPPAGTQAFGPSGPLGPVPGEIQLVRGDAEIRLTFAADGYQTGTARVTPSEDGAITVTLDRKPATATVKKRKKPVVRPTQPAAGSAVPTDPYSRK